MRNITQTKYMKKNITKEWLLTNGFRYNRLYSDEITKAYTYRFPVFKYERMTVLECEIRIYLSTDISIDKNIKINVFSYGTNDIYAPFYYSGYGNTEKMLKIINDEINKKLKSLEIQSQIISNKKKKKETIK